ncbi:hypothetical protein HAX54_008043 [Datura stramonium]|uniref:Uncharacterized protein n=1 Tax=Datura stramonium TaxID=4076 RepID=A0ABS8WZ27_DATST|nr:hypothetical protein [Datura stramonium]
MSFIEARDASELLYYELCDAEALCWPNLYLDKLEVWTNPRQYILGVRRLGFGLSFNHLYRVVEARCDLVVVMIAGGPKVELGLEVPTSQVVILFYEPTSVVVCCLLYVSSCRDAELRKAPDWSSLVLYLSNYKAKLHDCVFKWSMPDRGRIKYNSDRAIKGNPGRSSYRFWLRDYRRDFVYAQTKKICITSNIEAEAIEIMKALRYCFHTRTAECLHRD